MRIYEVTTPTYALIVAPNYDEASELATEHLGVGIQNVHRLACIALKNAPAGVYQRIADVARD